MDAKLERICAHDAWILAQDISIHHVIRALQRSIYRDSSYKRGIACQESYAKIGDWEFRTSLLSLVETCQDVNKHKEDRQIITYTSQSPIYYCVYKSLLITTQRFDHRLNHQFSPRIPDKLSPFHTKNP